MSYRQQNTNLPPIDKDVQVPAAIRAASLRADALHKEAYTAEGETNEPTIPAENKAPPEGKKEAEGERAAPAQPKQKDAPEDFEHKYKSLKPRFDRQDEMIVQLNSRIAQLESALTRSAKPSPAESRNPDLTFKPLQADEKEAYGEEFLDVAARAAREKLDPEIKNLRSELSQLKDTLGNVAEREDQNRKVQLYQYLTDQLPSWREVNRNPKFIAWCNLPDPFSGAIRMAMLSDAFARGDAPRVLRFFNGFLTDEAATAPAGVQPVPANALNGNGNGKVPLENFAAPGRAKAPAGSPPPEEKETITTAQIASFYLNVQKGHYRGNEAEKDRLERMIFEAQADGRVV